MKIKNLLGEEFSLNNNPLIKKYYYEQFRKEKIYKLLFGYFLILFSAYFYIFNVMERPYISYNDKLKLFHHWIIGLQIILYFIIGFNNIISAIVKEKDNKTFEFFKTLPLTYKDILIGKLIGPNLIVHFFQILTIPIFFVSGIIAGFSLKILFNVYILLFVGGWTLHFLGLFLSTFFRKQSNANLFLIIFIAYGLLLVIAPAQLFYKDKFPIIYFLGFPISITAYFIINCIFLIKVFSVGILQKLKNELDFPFTRMQALIIFITFCFLTIIKTENMGPELTAAVSSFGFYFLRVPVLFLLCLILTPDYAATLNWLKYRKSGITNFLKDGLFNSQSPIFVFVITGFIFLLVFTLFIAMLEFGFSHKIFTVAWEPNLLYFHNLLLLLLYLAIFQYGVLFTKENSYATGVKVLIAAGIILTLFFPKHLNILSSFEYSIFKYTRYNMSKEVSLQPLFMVFIFCLLAFYLLFLKYKYLSQQISK